MVICLERSADLHASQPMPLPLTVSCFSKIQISFTFLIPAHPGSPGQRAVKRVCVLHIYKLLQKFTSFLSSSSLHHCVHIIAQQIAGLSRTLHLDFQDFPRPGNFINTIPGLGTAVNRASGLFQGCISQLLLR